MHTKKDVLLPPLRLVNTLIPESTTKNRVRARLLKWRNALPRELMIQPGDTAVQIGMWRERNLRRLSNCVGPIGRVVLIEADQDVVARLSNYLSNHRIDNVTIVNKGAWSERGTFTMHVGRSAANNRLAADDVQMLGEMNKAAFVEQRVIEVDSVDNILAELGVEQVDYMEISVNGVERQVIEGMERMLPRTRRIFVAGYARLEEGTKPTNQIVESKLRSRGFQTRVTCETAPTQADFDTAAVKQWGKQDGHVFAWREAA